MGGDLIPNSDHVARYCGGAHFDDGKITGAAFRLKEYKQEGSLSVNWLEFFGKESRDDEIYEVRKAFAKIEMSIGKTAMFGVLNVGITKGDVAKEDSNRNIEFKHEPLEENQSHSGIHGLRYDDDVISDLIAQSVQETHPAIKP